jgi:hypothetical protein
MKYLITGLVLGALVFAPVVEAKPTEDCEKPAEEVRIESELQTKFSALHSKASKSYGGGFQQARYILERAVRDSQYGSAYNAAEDMERAIRAARRECVGTADKVVRMLDVMANASDDIYNSSDKVAVLRGGMNFLVQANPTMMTRDLLRLGISMTAPSMSSYSVAAEIFDVVIAEARREAVRDNKKEWESLLKFTVTASDSLYHFQSKYVLQSKVARAIVEARPGQAVYLKALALISSLELNSAFDQAEIIELGLREYSTSVPFENHREVTRYLVAAGDTIYNSTSKVRMFRSVMPNLVGLGTDTPAGKVVLRAALSLSACKAINASEAYEVAEIGVNHALRLSVPPFIRQTLKDGLYEAGRVYDSHRRVRIIRDYIQRAVR